jgi:hypothetical protein
MVSTRDDAVVVTARKAALTENDSLTGVVGSGPCVTVVPAPSTLWLLLADTPISVVGAQVHSFGCLRESFCFG